MKKPAHRVGWRAMVDKQTWAMIAQCGLSFLAGSAVWLAYPETPNPYERLLATLLAGFIAVWVVMFLWVWARYGWKAARGISMDG